MSDGTFKKICIFSAQYLPHMGGVERYTYYLAKEMVKRGHSVVVVTSQNEEEEMHVEAENNEGIEIYRLPSYIFVNGRMPVLKFNRQLKSISQELAKHRFDFVLINTRFYSMSLFGARFAKKNGIKSAVV